MERYGKRRVLFDPRSLIRETINNKETYEVPGHKEDIHRGRVGSFPPPNTLKIIVKKGIKGYQGKTY